VARIGSGTVVTGLTASALAIVTLLALQAKSSAQTSTVAGKPSTSASASASAHPSVAPKPIAVPAHSGTGKRIVYALGAKRVWLVDPAKPSIDRTFVVQPSPVDPLPGSYTVTGTPKVGPITGSDGISIKNVVVFTQHGSAVIGFSSAVDGTMPTPDPSKKTGGIRETLGDGQALFDFSSHGTKVVVVN
jgi:hypothetical protein